MDVARWSRDRPRGGVMELTGRAALITGGKRIGAVVATELARAGADVALVYRQSRPEAEETAAAVRALGRRAEVFQADLRQPEAPERIVGETAAAFGRLDILVHMASIYSPTPLGRWGGELEIAKTVLALVDSDFITGETIRVDGGRHVK